ncbi:proteoglycan Cow isoform X3 [Ceratitis capitata]|uniref:proteoglycan Cow isoform X3 n=1 Tax=Ceratitis capitata TaxID=7213 RepID=UPI0003299052|nr:proteoglycan Cow isoform X3 [Ceratitis capitata]
MRCLFLITTICLVLMSSGLSGAEAKKKKYVGENGGDFEFIDEINKNSQAPSKSSNGERKRWIHDPTSDLCRPLNCKKREICLLEDEYSAVCVSKRDLHKNRDEIITKAKYLEEEAAKRRASKDIANNNININNNNNNDNDNDDEDAKNFSSDEDSREDDVFYENNNTAGGDKDDEEDEDNCKPCPVAKPTFLCGADNRTYSSLCRLDYHNCIHSTSIRIACKGFCPCKENADGKRLQRISERQSAFNAKYKKTIEQQQQQQQQQQKQQMQQQLMYKDNNNNNNILDSSNDNLDNTLNSNNFNAIMDDNQYPEDKHKIRGYNEVVEKPQKYNKNSMNNGFPSKSPECKPQQLTAIGNRLLDWFSVIMADSKKRRQHSQKSKAHFPPACKTEAKWMFGHLDLNNDGYLSLQEMYDLEHDQNERCIKPFIDTCDLDQDNSINTREWCRCFEKTDRPCAAVRRRIAGDFAGEIGAYAPDCDIQGFYKPTQCHNSVGVCWCVDKHGVEFANTRTRGKPNCESVVNNASSLTSDDEDEETDDDDSAEGSADQMLVF